ncbi:MAG: ATP-dependent helicase [Bacteroidaceae bacterium]|nr:ATP-dependent helicase [Bacteroidaceae bacterium]
MNTNFTTRPAWAPTAVLPLADIKPLTVCESSHPNLNEQQLAALTPLAGHTLINSGAGTGKSTVLVARMQTILWKCPKAKILMLTFSRKAALELKARIGFTPNCQVSTFHSIAYHLLMANGFSQYRVDTNEAFRDQLISRLIGKADTTIEQVVRSLNRLSGIDTTTEKIKAKYFNALVKNKVLTFDSMQPFALKLLLEEENVLHQLQGAWNFILIDEYQDTDEVQQRLIELISAQSGNVCVVGDIRQAIYGFRGAEPGIMSTFATTAKVHELTVNYRSTPPIIGLANKIMPNEPPLIAASSDLSSYPQYLTAIDEADEASHIIQQIRKLHRDGIKYKYMAVLYRSSALSEAILPQLLEAKIPFVCKSHISLKFSRQPYLGIIKLLNYTLLPIENNFRSIMPFLYLGKHLLKDIKALAKKESLDYLAAAQKLPLPYFHLDYLASMSQALDSISPSTATSSAINTLLKAGYGKYIGEVLVPVIRAWSEELTEYGNLTTFMTKLYALQEQVKQIQANAAKHHNDCVQLMTIHASKGLEFNTVFLLGCYDGALPSTRDGIDLEEERRLMYVAVTRAKKNLYISYPTNSNNSTDENKASRFLQEAFSVAN